MGSTGSSGNVLEFETTDALLLAIRDRCQIAPNWKKVIDWKSLYKSLLPFKPDLQKL